MATTISSKFTGADRRKRAVTYGKSSRMESPMPPPVNEAASESAPSPERPRKQSGTGNSLKRPGGTLKASSTLGNTRATTSAPDIFDVPSDDDFGVPTVAKPTKKLVSKIAATAKKAPAETFDIPASDNDTSGPSRQSVKPLQPLRKPSQPPASVPKKLQKAAKVEIPPPFEPVAPQQRRGRTPQPTKNIEQALKSTTSQPVRPAPKPKAASRGTTPAPSAPPTTNTAKKLKSTSTLPAKKVAEKPSLKQTSDADIFDFPPSDNEAPLLSPRPARPLPLSRTKQSAKLGTSSTSKALVSPRELGESDDSNEQKKRKRQATAAVPAPTETRERKRDPSVPQRNRKYQKKEDSVSPGHEADKRSGALSPVEAEVALPKVNKPKRTRLRTEPNKFRPAMAKGQSSPARLHNMLPVRSLPKPSPVVEVPEAAPVEDETMYDIPDADAIPVPAARTTLSGTVTPRQKAFFSGLLGNSSQASPSMPSISKLMLTDRKPGDLAASLRRSVSDVSPSAPSRKSRLIDSLKQADETSEDEGSDSNDEEEDEEGEEDVTIIAGVATSSESNKNDQNASADGHEHMEIDSERATKSQASQGRVGQAFNSKLTYAKQRSYLEETNPEDALLLSMDIDDDLGFSSQKRDVFSEDDEDPASQVRGIHDLRRQGQHEKFQTEAQFWIDDISNNSKSNASIRRSSMMELTTKMADDKFIGQLLDSALAHQLFQNISSNGEIIFDFAATVATLFILQTKPGYNVLDQLHQCNIIATLTKLLEFELDIQRIAKDRKTNLAKRAQESVSDFRKLVQDSPVWSPDKPDKVSPQVVALKALELLTLGLRKAGGADTLIGQETIIKLVNIASNAYQRTKSGKGTSQDRLLLGIILSVLEAISVSQQRQVVWPNHVLHSLADLLPVFFEFDQSAQIMLTVKLCMNLTNNKPKACASFSESAFVQPLIRAINDRFTLLGTELIEEQRTEARESLILSLGAMINLAEFSDQARINVVVDGDELIDPLVKNFLLWSERAAQADSMEESQSTVAVGYLAVMLGNLCLNKTIRSKVRTGLPDQDMGMLIDKIKEFVRFHEHIDRKSRAFEGAEGRATLQNYTARLMQVVEGLEEAEA